MRSHFGSLSVVIASLAMVWLISGPVSLHAQKGGGGMSRSSGAMSQGGGGMSRSFSRPSSMSRSFGGGNSFSRSFSSPGNFSRSYRTPGSYSGSFNSGNFSRSYSAPRNYSRSFSSPNNYSRNLNSASSYSRNFNTANSYPRTVSPSRVSGSYGTRGSSPKSYAIPGNSSLNNNYMGNARRNMSAGSLTRSYESVKRPSRGFHSSNNAKSVVPAGISHASSATKNISPNKRVPGNAIRPNRSIFDAANSTGSTPLKYDKPTDRGKYGGVPGKMRYDSLSNNKNGHAKHYQDKHLHNKHLYNKHLYNKHFYTKHHHHYYKHFFFCPYGFGFNYFGSGFGLSFGFPFYGYRGFYAGPSYCGAYLSQPYYDYYAVTAPIVIETAPAEEVPEEIPIEPEPVSAPVENAGNGAIIEAAGHAAEFQLLAEEAFREQRYEDAARLVSHALIEDGTNGKLHLFASQTFFALGEYRAAAAAIQRAAAQLDPDDWGFVVENFRKFYSGRDYVTQMEDLVEFDKENPEASFASFLRGYHYNFLGYKESARKQLLQAVVLESRDKLAAELLVMAGGTPPEELPPVEQPAEMPGNPDEQQEASEKDSPDSK